MVPTRIKKRFNPTFSKKFPDGSMASFTFGTEIEYEYDGEHFKEELEGLFDLVVKSTVDDMKKRFEKDPIFRSVFSEIKRQVKNAEKVQEALKEDK
ncbi:MAG: hypothetical protein WC444_05435 [Candidatus Paceibacterota bacterium]